MKKVPVKLAQQGLQINEKKQKNTPLKELTVIIVGETVHYLVAYQIHKMRLKEKRYLQ